jgi:glucose-6-phosphate isomerase
VKLRDQLGGLIIDASGLVDERGATRFHGVAQAAWDRFRERARSGAVGFFDWPKDGAAVVAATRAVAERLRGAFDGALCLGIGGSYLGPAAIQKALDERVDSRFPVQWLSNVDPSSMRRAEAFLQGGRRALVVVSKSGATTETLAGFFHLARFVSKDAIVVVTDPEHGFLAKTAKAQGWAHLPIPANIGGRFSVLTPVGLLPTALLGASPEKLLAGAGEVRDALIDRPLAENSAVALAHLLHDADTRRGRKIQYLMPYRTELDLLASWYVQLWGESLGKRRRDGKAVGPTPVAALGTADQHSILQLLREGPADKVTGFVDVAESESVRRLVGEPPFPAPEFAFLFPHSFARLVSLAARATEQSLRNGGMPTYRLELTSVDERTLGAFFFFWETVCAVAGEFYDVNAFDQPGVEESKILWKAALGAQ